MYTIYEQSDGSYVCTVQVQDGIETFPALNRTEAIGRVVKAARELNGSYIRRNEVVEVPHKYENQITYRCSKEEYNLLQEINRGTKVVINFDNPYLKYRISDDELEYILDKRERESP